MKKSRWLEFALGESCAGRRIWKAIEGDPVGSAEHKLVCAVRKVLWARKRTT